MRHCIQIHSTKNIITFGDSFTAKGKLTMNKNGPSDNSSDSAAESNVGVYTVRTV